MQHKITDSLRECAQNANLFRWLFLGALPGASVRLPPDWRRRTSFRERLQISQIRFPQKLNSKSYRGADCLFENHQPEKRPTQQFNLSKAILIVF
jgi:hypothetical protein